MSPEGIPIGFFQIQTSLTLNFDHIIEEKSDILLDFLDVYS